MTVSPQALTIELCLTFSLVDSLRPGLTVALEFGAVSVSNPATPHTTSTGFPNRASGPVLALMGLLAGGRTPACVQRLRRAVARVAPHFAAWTICMNVGMAPTPRTGGRQARCPTCSLSGECCVSTRSAAGGAIQVVIARDVAGPVGRQRSAPDRLESPSTACLTPRSATARRPVRPAHQCDSPGLGRVLGPACTARSVASSPPAGSRPGDIRTAGLTPSRRATARPRSREGPRLLDV